MRRLSPLTLVTVPSATCGQEAEWAPKPVCIWWRRENSCPLPVIISRSFSL